MRRQQRYGLAASCIGVMLGILLDRYSKEEVMGMLSPEKLEKAIEIVGGDLQLDKAGGE